MGGAPPQKQAEVVEGRPPMGAGARPGCPLWVCWGRGHLVGKESSCVEDVVVHWFSSEMKTSFIAKLSI